MNIKEALSRTLIETTLFLEFSDEESINPDVSVAHMEEIAAILQNMDDNGKNEFLKTCTTVASEYKNDVEKSEFIMSIGENLGLVE